MKTKTKGIIAAGHPQTAEAAIRAFEEGGNAFDAAVAALFATFVTETCMSSVGGGAFANVMTASGKAHIFDFFCQTPRKKRPESEIEFYPVIVDLGNTNEVFHIGRGASGVPGALAGIYSLYENLCTLPLQILAEPVIEIAKNGAYIDNFQALDFQMLKAILEVDKTAQKIWYKDEKLLEEGTHLYMPNLADFIENLVREGQSLFYKGEIAQKIAAEYAQNGGQLTREDFENYRVNITSPLRFNYKNKTVLTTSAPSMGGALIALGMRQLNQSNRASHYSEATHVKNLYDTYVYVNDLHSNPEKLERELLEYGLTSTVADTGKRGSTTHFSIADEHGNAIAVTTSNGEGNGYVVPDTDIMMNNMLGEAALLPNGFHSWKENTRLTSMMSPTIMLDESGRVEAVTGSGGAGRIPGVILQVLHYLIDYQMNVHDAVHAPRLHLEHGRFNLEPGFADDLSHIPIKEEINRWAAPALYFGGVHTIHRKNNRMEAAGDDRRKGVVKKNF